MRNEAAERLREWIEETPDANVALRQAATTELDAALAEERHHVIEQIEAKVPLRLRKLMGLQPVLDDLSTPEQER